MATLDGAMIITGQFFLDDAIVAEKQAAGDYAVSLSPVVEVDGDLYRVVLDGNHSLAAALADGVEPQYSEIDRSNDLAADLLDAGDVDGYLAFHADGDYYDPMTWQTIW